MYESVPGIFIFKTLSLCLIDITKHNKTTVLNIIIIPKRG